MKANCSGWLANLFLHNVLILSLNYVLCHDELLWNGIRAKWEMIVIWFGIAGRRRIPSGRSLRSESAATLANIMVDKEVIFQHHLDRWVLVKYLALSQTGATSRKLTVSSDPTRNYSSKESLAGEGRGRNYSLILGPCWVVSLQSSRVLNSPWINLAL